MAGSHRWTLGGFRSHQVDRVLDHQRNRRRAIREAQPSSAEGRDTGKERRGTDVPAHLRYFGRIALEE